MDFLSTLLLACPAILNGSSHIIPAVYFPSESPVICRKREESRKFYPSPDTSHHAAATSSGHFKSIQLSDPESENLNGSHASRCLLQLSCPLCPPREPSVSQPQLSALVFILFTIHPVKVHYT